MKKFLITVAALLFTFPSFSKTSEDFSFDGIKLGDNYNHIIYCIEVNKKISIFRRQY